MNPAQASRACEHCGQSFIGEKRTQRFCSKPCASRAQGGSFPARFWRKVDQSAGPAGCWLWTGAVNSRTSRGYGVAWAGDRIQLAHRVAYELVIGPIPDDADIDHLCRNRLCVNPAHLEPVTHRENVLRGEGPSAREARKTHCKNGHEFTPENTYAWPARPWQRQCRRCVRDRQRRARAQARGA